jgi:uncharacterized membrane protein YkvA (DUF1232 family)
MTDSNENLTDNILKSVFFKSAEKKAGRTAQNTAGILELLKQVFEKLNNTAEKDGKGIMQVLKERIFLLGRMLKAYTNGAYRALPWKSLLKIMVALIYFVSPIDFIPDFLPIVGFTDDLAIVVWIFKSLQNDINDFEEWEKQQFVEFEDFKI